MAEYAPEQNFKHPVCRGSWAFGNNCKVCERCQATHPGKVGTQLLPNPNHTDTSRSGDLVERLRTYTCLHGNRHVICEKAADRIEALEARVAELEDIAGDLLTRFEPWSPHDHDAAKRARAALKEIEGD